ncbi:MAG: carbamoyltransferase HypF [Acidobacteriota bacterium]|nr:carbamoyltransferase HypF [Acidobacteriota bacterium]
MRGIVQGVGFRPYVYNLAHKLGLAGYVLNSSAGVTIEVEGANGSMQKFLDALQHRPPPLALIKEFAVTEMEAQGESGFSIHESHAEAGEFVLVSPDVATCDDCWRDFGDPSNRRAGYPFTNCTNCGPRYTIIQDIPYDRPATTMAPFTMCQLCQAEYEDPANRRFHAQPNACPACGPALALVKSGSSLPTPSSYRASESAAVIHQARALVHQGKIVAVKGLGGFLLACDATNDAAVRQLRTRKRRSDKPFALMARDVAATESFCIISDAERTALLNARRPIVVLRRRPDSTISPAVAPGNNTIGVMLPYTPLHYMLFSDSPEGPPEFTALVMTSGNLSEEPIVISNEEAWQRLQTVADWFVFHNRDIYMRTDDSVVRTFEAQERALRRSRGYVPHPIDVGVPLREVLACGAELKNTLCLTKGNYAILSQHIGDLENYETLLFFEETLTNLKKLFRVEPQAVAYDLHPQYISTRFALGLPLDRKISVQHHHAHIASCMAENHVRDKVIGVAFDGTGYGTDGKIWGGEFLVADFAGFERRGHLRYVPLPGGDAAVRQPWRMAISYLRDAFGDAPFPASLGFLNEIAEQHVGLVRSMLDRRINCIDTSSCGRLFDAVASLINLRQEVNFEGQAAIELEMIAQPGVDEAYPFNIDSGEPAQVDMRPMIENIVRDLLRSKPPAYIAARFHNTIATVILEVCRRIRAHERLNRVCLSGGTFQNVYLLQRCVENLRRDGYEVYLHAQVPPNDGGISLGQAMIANEILQRGD